MATSNVNKFFLMLFLLAISNIFSIAVAKPAISISEITTFPNSVVLGESATATFDVTSIPSNTLVFKNEFPDGLKQVIEDGFCGKTQLLNESGKCILKLQAQVNPPFIATNLQGKIVACLKNSPECRKYGVSVNIVNPVPSQINCNDAINCNGVCVYLATDNSNCGTCGNACSTTPNGTSSCIGGTCSILSCNIGYGNCNDACINTWTDVNHCGACRNICSYANAASTCTSGACAMVACNPLYGNCDGNSINGCEQGLAADTNNCGACGNTCSYANAAPACFSGTCALGTCNPSYGNCDSNSTNGCETSLAADTSNCGACGNTCSYANAASTCSSGACAIGTCNPLYGNCDGSSINGCENHLATNTSNCGSCGNICSYTNAAPICSLGTCAMGACNPLYGNCDGNSTDGCETSLTTDTSNCGACGNTCSYANAASTCSSGACALGACNPSYGNCDGNSTNGCENHLATNTSNCGSCGNICSYANASPICSLGTCALGACNPLYGNCNGNSTDGCETSLAADTSNCGACENICSYANAASTCSSGACAMGECNTGYASCDGSFANGCEQDIATDINHCGSCTNVCSYNNAAPACFSGNCALGTCNTLYGNCDGNSANGCEKSLATDTNNCGACRNVCSYANAVPTCSHGTCAMGDCTYLYGNCDGNSANGCEKSLATDTNNCGACGNVCSYANAVPTCSHGTCAMGDCTYLYGNCDGSSANGCEINLDTDVNNCNGCGIKCPTTGGTPKCSSGVCGYSTG